MMEMSAISLTLIELGGVIFGLSIVARLASKLGVSAIPFYLLAGLAIGNNSLLPLPLSESFVHLGAQIGVILLLFTLGLEYSSERLKENIDKALPAAIVDLILNFPPGFIAGLLFGWGWLPALLLGGITYISSSGIIAKLLTDLNRTANGETPVVMSILVLEDIAMAIFLPLITIFLVGQGLVSGLLSILVAVLAGGGMLFVAMRYGKVLSRWIEHSSDEIVILTTLGLAILVGGLAEGLQLSAAVGAFMVGITISGSAAKRTHELMHPLTDWFAATFFLFFGMGIELASLPPVLLPAIALGLLTALTKVMTGWLTTRHMGLEASGRVGAGLTLIARGEFSLVIAGLGMSAGLEPKLGALAAAYVLLLAIVGPLLARAIEPTTRLLRKGKHATVDAIGSIIPH